MRLLVVTLVIFFLLISTTKADDFDCLVEALYHEARSESLLGMLSVANVILTRKESSNYPNTICKVVHQGKYWKDNPVRDKCHFSYWCDGRMSLKGIQVRQTVGSTHYHASYVTPRWASNSYFKSLGQLGNHIFYIDTTP